MPLPGKDVAFPGGTLGERYREFLRMDGLDPDNIGLNKHKYARKVYSSDRTVLKYHAGTTISVALTGR